MRWENVKQFWEQWCRKYLSYERANRLKCQTGSECFEKCWWNGEKMGSWCPRQERHCNWKTSLSLKVQTQVWLLQHHICFCCCFKFEWPQCFFWPGWENKPVALARMGVCNWRNYPRSSLCNCLDNNYADVNYPQSCTHLPLCNCSDNSGAPFWPKHRWGQQEFTAFPKHHLWPSHYSVALSITEVVV